MQGSTDYSLFVVEETKIFSMINNIIMIIKIIITHYYYAIPKLSKFMAIESSVNKHFFG